jgi:MinD-like ATPase involved in chromosome partitioning or flagellar assembly
VTTIAVCCGKGSPGATFVAMNLAAALARKNESIVLVDLDLSGGDVSAYLGLDPRKGLHLLAKIAGPAPSSDKVRSEIQEVEGVGLIGGIPNAEPNATINPVAVAENSRVLADTVIFDTGRIPGPSLAANEKADRILVVIRPDLISVLGAERCLAGLERESIPKEKIELVITAHRRRRVAELVDVGRALGFPVVGVIPWVPGAARRALEQQRPVKNGTAARAFSVLATKVTADPDHPRVIRAEKAVSV